MHDKQHSAADLPKFTQHSNMYRVLHWNYNEPEWWGWEPLSLTEQDKTLLFISSIWFWSSQARNFRRRTATRIWAIRNQPIIIRGVVHKQISQRSTQFQVERNGHKLLYEAIVVVIYDSVTWQLKARIVEQIWAAIARQRAINSCLRQRTRMQQKNRWRRYFLCGLCQGYTATTNGRS
jgi:hypothetical protein